MMDHALLVEGRREEGELVPATNNGISFRVLRNLASKESRTRRIRNRRIVTYRVATQLLRYRHVRLHCCVRAMFSPRRNQIPL